MIYSLGVVERIRIMNKLVFVLLLWTYAASATVRLQETYSWNVLDWNFPNEYSKQLALQNGALIPENALPVGIERWRNKLFVSVPRWKQGIPATLNYIPLDAPYEPSPKLTPYPSLQGNELGNCESGLNTVYRLKVDKCDRLWVLDTGTYGYDPNVTNVCPYTLNVFDLNTDRRVRRYVFRPEDIVPTTFIANIALDEGATCDDTFAYFSDELGYGLIAYSWQQNKSWRFGHNFFMPDPLNGDYNIAGLNFQWGAEGIFGISASPVGTDGFRTLHFSPLSSSMEFAVSTRILRDETKVKGSFKDFKIVGSRGADGHSTAKVIDESGVHLFALVDQNAVGCWESSLPYKPQNMALIDKDDNALIFPSDVKIDNDRNVWVMSDRMPVFLESTLDYGDINFRIFTAPLNDLLAGTVCEPRNPNYQKPVQPLSRYGLNSSPFRSSSVVLTSPLSITTTTYSLPTAAPNVVPNQNQAQNPLGYYNRDLSNTIPRVSSVFNFPTPAKSIPYYTNQNTDFDRNFGSSQPKSLNVDFPQFSTPASYIPDNGQETSLQKRPWWISQQYAVREDTS